MSPPPTAIMRMLTALLALQLQGALASRLVAHQARRTDAAEIRFDGWSPEPTPSPKIAHDEILRRSYDSLLPNPTCGYIDNLLESSVTCAAGGYCGFNTAVGYAGCCNTALTIDYTLYSLSDCNVQTACYDSTDASSYTSAASTDASLAVCTDAIAPYCFKYSYTDAGVTAFGCSAASTDLSVGSTWTDYGGGGGGGGSGASGGVTPPSHVATPMSSSAATASVSFASYTGPSATDGMPFSQTQMTQGRGQGQAQGQAAGTGASTMAAGMPVKIGAAGRVLPTWRGACGFGIVGAALLCV